MAYQKKEKKDPIIASGYACKTDRALSLTVPPGNTPVTIAPGKAIPPMPQSKIEAMLEKGQIEELFVPDDPAATPTGEDTYDSGKAPPSKALKPEDLEGLDLVGLNTLAAENGYDGPEFEDVNPAFEWLTTNHTEG